MAGRRGMAEWQPLRTQALYAHFCNHSLLRSTPAVARCIQHNRGGWAASTAVHTGKRGWASPYRSLLGRTPRPLAPSQQFGARSATESVQAAEPHDQGKIGGASDAGGLAGWGGSKRRAKQGERFLEVHSIAGSWWPGNSRGMAPPSAHTCAPSGPQLGNVLFREREWHFTLTRTY